MELQELEGLEIHLLERMHVTLSQDTAESLFIGHAIGGTEHLISYEKQTEE